MANHGVAGNDQIADFSHIDIADIERTQRAGGMGNDVKIVTAKRLSDEFGFKRAIVNDPNSAIPLEGGAYAVRFTDLHQWKLYDKGTSFPYSAFDTNSAVHRIHELFNDGEPEPGALMLTARGVVDLFKWLKDGA